MNWMVDRLGVLDQKSYGFELRGPDWPAQMLEKLSGRR
jgi:hypothetical protein